MRRIWRWLRWVGTGFLSAASPLPWLVDVTSARFDALERRVEKLEQQPCQRTWTTALGRMPWQ